MFLGNMSTDYNGRIKKLITYSNNRFINQEILHVYMAVNGIEQCNIVVALLQWVFKYQGGSCKITTIIKNLVMVPKCQARQARQFTSPIYYMLDIAHCQSWTWFDLLCFSAWKKSLFSGLVTVTFSWGPSYSRVSRISYIY